MGSRDRVRMTPSEVDRFLGSHRKVQVAVNGHDGVPHLTTLFYMLDEQRRICFWTYGTSQKIKNLERDARISGLVEDGEEYAELRGVSLRGRRVGACGGSAPRDRARGGLPNDRGQRHR